MKAFTDEEVYDIVMNRVKELDREIEKYQKEVKYWEKIVEELDGKVVQIGAINPHAKLRKALYELGKHQRSQRVMKGMAVEMRIATSHGEPIFYRPETPQQTLPGFKDEEPGFEPYKLSAEEIYAMEITKELCHSHMWSWVFESDDAPEFGDYLVRPRGGSRDPIVVPKHIFEEFFL